MELPICHFIPCCSKNFVMLEHINIITIFIAIASQLLIVLTLAPLEIKRYRLYSYCHSYLL